MSPGIESSSIHKVEEIKELEEGEQFIPQFDQDGLIPAIAVHAETREILMFAWMNNKALQKTIHSGEAWYWSRKRKKLWHKGSSSGQIQEIINIRIDCDQDVIQLQVIPKREGACHVGYRSCFYRSVKLKEDGSIYLNFEETEKII